MTYDPRKAQLFNSLIQSGLSEDAAFVQSGITAAETGDYALGSNGQLGAIVAGTGVLVGTEGLPFLRPPSIDNLESVPFPLVATANPSEILAQISNLRAALPPLPTLPNLSDLTVALPGLPELPPLPTLPNLSDLTVALPGLPELPPLPSLSDLSQIPTDLAAISTGFAAGFTADLPTLPSIIGALRLTAAQVAGLAQAAQDTAAGLLADIKRLPEAIPESLSPYITTALIDASAAAGLTAINDLLIRQNATIQKAKAQATLEARNNTAAAATDWRVRLQLASDATYLYKDQEAGILTPLRETNGIIFPYTPSIETNYNANYEKYDLTHSNYRGYFYKNSAVNDINIRGTFTAQDTTEADYLLAVIHFFRSVTKMFYGQGNLRGSPPALVYLSGFGDYQFNKHPCLISNFSYSLPDGVDYIRAGAPNNYGNLFSQRAKTGGISTSPTGAVIQRLSNSGLPTAPDTSPTPSMINQNVNNLTGATYVPTKIEINVTLLPTNTRSQVSQQFNLKKYADGSLIKGGYW